MEELKFGRKSKVNLESQNKTYKKYKSDLIENGIVKSASSAIYVYSFNFLFVDADFDIISRLQISLSSPSTWPKNAAY